MTTEYHWRMQEHFLIAKCSIFVCMDIETFNSKSQESPTIKKKKNTGVGCPFLPQGIFLNQGLNIAASPTLQADSLTSEPPGKNSGK